MKKKDLVKVAMLGLAAGLLANGQAVADEQKSANRTELARGRCGANKCNGSAAYRNRRYNPYNNNYPYTAETNQCNGKNMCNGTNQCNGKNQCNGNNQCNGKNGNNNTKNNNNMNNNNMNHNNKGSCAGKGSCGGVA